MSLPLLPTPEFHHYYHPHVDSPKHVKCIAYSEAQMREYGEACRKAALQEAAAEFDKRDKGAGGFYNPEEPALIIRSLK